jgi:hypothetical protein
MIKQPTKFIAHKLCVLSCLWLFVLFTTNTNAQTGNIANISITTALPSGWQESGVSYSSGAVFASAGSYYISPAYDLSDYSNVTLSMAISKNINTDASGALTVSVSNDGGVTWTAQSFNSATTASTSNTTSGPHSITVSGSNVKIKLSRENSTAPIKLKKFVLSGDGIPSLNSTGSLHEPSLNGSTIVADLSNTVYASNLDAGFFGLLNAPIGLSIGQVIRNSDTQATLILSYNGFDFDTNVNNLKVTVAANQVEANINLTSNSVVLYAINEQLAVTPGATTMLNYDYGAGPSDSYVFQVTASNLDVVGGNIIISGSSYYEFSLTGNNVDFSPTVTIPFPVSGTIAGINFWVRLRDGLLPGNYSNQTITITGGKGSASITANGKVIGEIPVNDLCQNALPVIINNINVQGNLYASTYTDMTYGDGNHDVWYKLTANCSDTYKISVSGFSGDVDVFLYQGECPDSAIDNVDSAETFDATEVILRQLDAGVYYIRILDTGFGSVSPSSFSIKVQRFTTELTTVNEGEVVAEDLIGATIQNQPNIACGATAYGVEYSIEDNFAEGAGTAVAATSVTNGTYTLVLTGLNQGTVYYFRCYEDNAVGRSYGPQQSFLTEQINIWNGQQWSVGTPLPSHHAVIEGNYATGTNGNLDIAKIIVNSGNFVVSSGTTLAVKKGIDNNAQAANFVVQNNASVIQASKEAGINEGAITVQKTSSLLYREDYTLWSSPVANQELKAFSPTTLENRFYDFSPELNQFNPVNPVGTNFETGKGYLIRMPNSQTTPGYNTGATAVNFYGNFKGVPNNGDINVPTVSYAAGSVQGFNIIGNPYPSPVNIYDFYDANEDNFGPNSALFFWRKRNNSDTPSYCVLTKDAYTANAAGSGGLEWESLFNGTDPSTWVINPGQGFFVQAGSNHMVFNNSMRSGDSHNNQFFKQPANAADARSRFWFNLTGNNDAFSQMAVVYSSTATLGLDFGREAAYQEGGRVTLYSIAENKYLTIQARPGFTADDKVKLGYQAVDAGTYQITLHRKDGVFEGDQEIYIKDNVLGITHKISDGLYSFATEAGTFNDRFEVVYNALGETMETDTQVFNENSVVVYKNGSAIEINSGTTDITTVEVYDMRGRLLYSQKAVNDSKVSINNLQSQQQVLIVNIVTEKGAVSKKIVY